MSVERKNWSPEETAYLIRAVDQGRSDAFIAEALGRAQSAVISKRQHMGLLTKAMSPRKMPTLRAVPDDWAQVAPTMYCIGLRKHYDTSFDAIERWARETGIQPMRAEGPRRVPADWAERCSCTTRSELQTVYGVGETTIARWVRESGVYPLGPKRQNPRRKWNPTTQKAILVQNIDTSLVGRAAQYLRKWMPVYNASVADPKASKDEWICGRTRLTTQDLIAKAESKGFDPREWTRAA
jgi:hypothetical protein